MSFNDFIGKHIEKINLSKNDYKIEFEDEEWMREEGIEPKWTEESKDGSYSMSLNENKIIGLML